MTQLTSETRYKLEMSEAGLQALTIIINKCSAKLLKKWGLSTDQLIAVVEIDKTLPHLDLPDEVPD